VASLDRNLRKDLENAVKKGRRVAEAGALEILEQLAVNHHEPWLALAPEQRKLRNRLRAHGRQLGDRIDDKGSQTVDRLAAECAYEHWHRLLFARFLAENNLLVEPESGVALSLDECRELARDRGVDWLLLASEFAQEMLPQIFRVGNPVLEVKLSPERRQELERILETLPSDVFIADDSLGWVYQYWQAEPKASFNSSGSKIGADELPAATQVFTEDYMVLYLLHNTIGAWWTARRNARGLSTDLPGYSLDYLRFRPDGSMAAGGFENWATTARDFRLLDSSMGSGHFLAFSVPLLAAIRQVEEGFSREDAVAAVLRENIFGLEVDPRCTQIAAFNLAMTAWRLGCGRTLPALNLACSGLGINAKQTAWSELAGEDVRARQAMADLYELFNQAPLLGSLIDPTRVGGTLLSAAFESVVPHFEQAIAAEGDESRTELAVAAKGLAKAARLMATRFTLVVTNVPYLGRAKQTDSLRTFCAETYPNGKADLATCFLERCLEWCEPGGTVALVTPQNWLFLSGYRNLREELLRNFEWNMVVKLGPAAFQDMNFWASTTALVVLSRIAPAKGSYFSGFDVSEPRSPQEKAELLLHSSPLSVSQDSQLNNPDARIVFGEMSKTPLLSRIASYGKGSTTGDSPHYHRYFWELPALANRDVTLWLDSPEPDDPWSGRHLVMLGQVDNARLREENGCRIHGQEVWGRRGIAVNKMNELKAFIYTGEVFDDNIGVIAPRDPAQIPGILSYCESGEYASDIREIDQAVKVTAATLVKVPFDLERWQAAGSVSYPEGLPRPFTPRPSQWLFSGHPEGAHNPLQVAVARLLGFQWPRQSGSAFLDCAAVAEDDLTGFSDDDGIVCLGSLRGELAAADRLRAILARAFGTRWSGATQQQLLAAEGCTGQRLEDWLRDKFFEQHCNLFRQRPFIWHIWDGVLSGFSALVNYHKLAAPNGEGRRNLEKLIYAYLGDWIDRQRDDQKKGVEGADGRVTAAEHLKGELERILEGEPPYDIFVRWKPLHEQPVGWEPDIDDGVRINIRPFMVAKPLNGGGKNACILRTVPKIKWDKDRGREAPRIKSDYPWFWAGEGQTPGFMGGSEFDGKRWNDFHYSRASRLAARIRAKGERL
jgi:hypothetical protein